MADTGVSRVLTGDTVVLSPRGRRAKLERRRVVAFVDLDGVDEWGYRHPVLSLGLAGREGDSPRSSESIAIRFQCDREVDGGRAGSKGFLSPGKGRKWTYAYGGTLTTGFDCYSARSVMALLRLYKRSLDANVRGVKRDHLLGAIIGLQRIGVQVTIKSHGVREARERRAYDHPSLAVAA